MGSARCKGGEGICTLLLLHVDRVFTNKITELQNELYKYHWHKSLAGAELILR